MHLRRLVSKTTFSSSSAAAGWAPLPIRLIVGFGFLAHGYAKLSRGPESFGVVLQTLGVPVPQLLAWLTTLVELIGGGAVLAGAFIPLVRIYSTRQRADGNRVADCIIHGPFPVWILLGEVCRSDGGRDPVRACRLRNHPALPGLVLQRLQSAVPAVCRLRRSCLGPRESSDRHDHPCPTPARSFGD
jgi:hypothetical protein